MNDGITYENIDIPTIKRKRNAAQELLVNDREAECQREIAIYLHASSLCDTRGELVWTSWPGARITKIGRKRVTLDFGDYGTCEVDLAAQAEPYRVRLIIR